MWNSLFFLSELLNSVDFSLFLIILSLISLIILSILLLFISDVIIKCILLNIVVFIQIFILVLNDQVKNEINFALLLENKAGIFLLEYTKNLFFFEIYANLSVFIGYYIILLNFLIVLFEIIK